MIKQENKTVQKCLKNAQRVKTKKTFGLQTKGKTKTKMGRAGRERCDTEGKHGIKLWKERQIGQRNWLLGDPHKSTDIKGRKE